MKTINVGPVSLTKTAFSTLLRNPVILYPFFLLAIIEFFVLELIYFAPRYPLSMIFEPVIVKTVGSKFLHYPYNYFLLSKWFHAIEVPIVIFLSSFFYGASVLIVALINSGHMIEIKAVFRRVFERYVNLAAATLLAVVLLQVMFWGHGLVIKRAMMIRSGAGPFFWIKKVVLVTSPYVHLFLPCLIGALLAFVIPIIVLERRNVIEAIKFNFTQYGSLLGMMLIVILISDIVYLPLIFWRLAQINHALSTSPDMSAVWLIVSIIVTLLVGALQCTASTLCYLFKNEART